MQTVKNELEKIMAVKRAFEWLCDGEVEAASILIHIKGTYKDWANIFTWLKMKRIRGAGLVEIFKNESPDGDGYLLGMTWILSRMKGHKFGTNSVKINELQ